MADPPRNLPHLYLHGGGQAEGYTSPGGFREPGVPVRDRTAHAQALEYAIGQALAAARDQIATPDPAARAGAAGYYLEIELAPGQQAAIDQLGNRTKGVEVAAVRELLGQQKLTAAVFVPQAAETYFLDKVREYRAQDTPKGRPKNERLVARLDAARLASVRSLYTDEERLYPRPGQAIWWEIWLRREARAEFLAVAARLGVRTSDQAVRFPEREVLLALADEATLARIMQHSDLIRELRVARDSPAHFLEMDAIEQRAWSDELLSRLTEPSEDAPAVCILDSGLTAEHPLIRPAVSDRDLHTYDPSWSVADDGPTWKGHGTGMAGLALYGDLGAALLSSGAVVLGHRLESVKILPPTGSPPNEPRLYGAITGEAVARAELEAPHRSRVICMAVTSDAESTGRPSSWSSELDQLCYRDGDGRLFLVAAGNLPPDVVRREYLARNDLERIQDPAQAWNALTVGACTDKVNLSDPSYQGWIPIAPAGDLSPCSRTSVNWDRRWPLKPEVVLEGGNLAACGDTVGDVSEAEDLQLLSTDHQPVRRLFRPFGGTSAACAEAARLAASILSARPALWPETVRALIVHSAEWTPAMLSRFERDLAAGAGRRARADSLNLLLRRYGYGVPSLHRALLSASNDLTLVVEDALQPFEKRGAVKTREMKVHQLPWPRAELESLGAEPVELRMTLSYFVEPNPSERGWATRHRYASHGLRFAVKRATETLDEFRQRVNRAVREEEEGRIPTAYAGSDNWRLGQLRDRGSIHSDLWRGTAVELAQRDAISVFPVGGWWKEKPFLQRWSTPARYALVVTIRAPGAVVDIYTPVALSIETAVITEITS